MGFQTVIAPTGRTNTVRVIIGDKYSVQTQMHEMRAVTSLGKRACSGFRSSISCNWKPQKGENSPIGGLSCTTSSGESNVHALPPSPLTAQS